jgi:serine/threonine protein kinase
MKSNTFICILHELYGYSLYDILTMYKNENLSIPIEFILEMIKQSSYTLSIIHKNGYVHSDIKPENILVRKPKLYFSKLKTIIDNLKTKHRYSKKQINKFIEDMKKHLIDYIDNDHKEDIKEVYKYLFESTKPEFVICDMGSLMRKQSEDIFRRHTVYYRSPEVLLYNGDQFDEKYDAWSLVCSIYEIIMGKVLFDPEDGDITRSHLFLISECFGILPKHMIEKSKKKHLFFSKNMERIRGYSKIEFKPIFVFLLEKIMVNPPNPNYDKHLKLINIIKDLLDCDVTTRLSVAQIITTYFK